MDCFGSCGVLSPFFLVVFKALEDMIPPKVTSLLWLGVTINKKSIFRDYSFSCSGWLFQLASLLIDCATWTSTSEEHFKNKLLAKNGKKCSAPGNDKGQLSGVC